jgi:hypothetical protein
MYGVHICLKGEVPWQIRSEPMMGPGMVGMMQQTSGMMEGCSKMMQSEDPGGSERPDEQWRKDVPHGLAPRRRTMVFIIQTPA